MFKELGQFASLMKNLPKIREEMDKLQGKLSQITAEGDAGAGMVKVRVNGHMEVVGLQAQRRGRQAQRQGISRRLDNLGRQSGPEKGPPGGGGGNRQNGLGPGDAAGHELAGDHVTAMRDGMT